MEENFVDIVLSKEFSDLSEIEKTEMKSWFDSEEEFYHLKNVFLEVENIKRDVVVPRESSKKSLDDLFAQRNKKVVPVLWYNSVMVALYPKDKPAFQRPLLQIAAIGLIVLLVYPFMFKGKIGDEKTEIAAIEKFEGAETTQKQNVKEQSGLNESSASETPISTFVEPVITEESLEIPFETALGESVEDLESSEVATFATDMSVVPSVKFEHPDGIFTGASSVTYSKSASSQPEIFDLLTAAF